MQNAEHFRKFYVPHHFIFYPVCLVFIGFAVYRSLHAAADFKEIWLAVAVLAALITALSFMLRQHYALGLQNSIVKNELDFRYFAKTGRRLQDLNYNFTDSQLFALRFATDDDLPQMVEKTMQNGWDADAIRKNIPQWKPDNQRV